MCTAIPNSFSVSEISSPSVPEGNLFVWQWDPKKVKGGWVPEEDALLSSLVSSIGPNWKTIATYFPSRTGKQCRERYINSLDPNIKSAPWSEEEDQIIINYHQKSGNRWSEVAKLLSGRTANAIKNRWHSNLKRRLERMESPKSKKLKTSSASEEKSQPVEAPVAEIFRFDAPEILFSSVHGLLNLEAFSSDSDSSSPSSPISEDEIDMTLFEDFQFEEKFYPSEIQGILDFGNVNHLIYS